MVDINRGVYPQQDCTSFRAGHTMHWIQARHAYDNPETHVPVEVLDVTEDEIVLVGDGTLFTFRNHALDGVREVVRVFGPLAVLMSVGVLRFPSGHLISVSPVDRAWLDCTRE